MIAYETFKRHRNRLVKRFIETGSVTKDRVDDIRQRMDANPNKSVRKLALQTGISRGSADMAVRDDDLDRSFFSDEAWFHLSGYKLISTRLKLAFGSPCQEGEL
ncbi:hypothetical protein Trydic_g10537 [Trypoxylus dichotomus]